jgi:hypothetical protein
MEFVCLFCWGATEHSSTRPRFPTHHLLNVSLQIANKLRNLKKKVYRQGRQRQARQAGSSILPPVQPIRVIDNLVTQKN